MGNEATAAKVSGQTGDAERQMRFDALHIAMRVCDAPVDLQMVIRAARDIFTFLKEG